MTVRSWIIGVGMLAGVGGCSLGRGAPPPQHFILGGDEVGMDATAPRLELGGMAVGIRRLQIASYLGTPFIVVRRGDEEITLSDFNRWGEPLALGIGRAVAGYLAEAADFGVVRVAPWPAQNEHDYLIELNVLRFEGIAPADPQATAGEVHLLADWQILRAADGEVAARGRSDFRQPGWAVDDYAGLVTQLNTGLRALSAELLAELSALSGGR